ncbi:MAG: ankyrin repeat domain-containing protein [Kiritimatiellae bacterium]|nr:ankyrin repeat domain-containing protein [Kiritimatiellia bacterium]
MRRGKIVMRSVLAGVCMVFLLCAVHSRAAEIKVVTEYIYPTSYRVVPIMGTGPTGLQTIIGAIVEPQNFQTREVGVYMSVWATAAEMAKKTQGLPGVQGEGLNGNTPLMIAAASGDYAATYRLLARGAQVNARNRFGSTALMGAAAGGYTDIVELLLRAGADVNARSKEGATALMFAARNGHLDAVKLLLRYGAAVNAMDADGLSPLMYAVSRGHEEVVNLLLRYGAMVDTRDRYGTTPLKLASVQQDQGIVMLLTRAGARR